MCERKKKTCALVSLLKGMVDKALLEQICNLLVDTNPYVTNQVPLFATFPKLRFLDLRKANIKGWG